MKMKPFCLLSVGGDGVGPKKQQEWGLEVRLAAAYNTLVGVPVSVVELAGNALATRKNTRCRDSRGVCGGCVGGGLKSSETIR